MLHSAEELARLVNEVGFLPMFANRIRGFSAEECTPPEYYFSDQPGLWEWKGPAIRLSGGVYGKFFGGKAGFVSREWLPDFLNYRRDGYDYEARFEDGLSKRKDFDLLQTLEQTGPCISTALKQAAGYGKGGRKGFDTVITRLQAQTYVVTADFEYAVSRDGSTYGWGLARYAMPEQLFGQDFISDAYRRSPAESYERMLNHLKDELRDTDESLLRAFLG